jgi:AraC family transcriptional regulator of adaptative response/methylated-DNA-[protein]-cysteine methyltransferase
MEAVVEDPRWRAVRDRDAAQDGRFVYAVRTTGVFCRPSCRSRPPRRENVEFYAGPSDAEAAGYRACLRCRPTGPDPRAAEARLVTAAARALEGDDAVTTEALAERAGVGVNRLLRLFKAHTGVTPQAYRRRVLAERAREELGGAEAVGDAVFAAGYRASSRFYDGVGRELGMDPREARTGAGWVVRCTTRGCSLGRVLVAWTARGVCEVGFGDDDHGLLDDLRRRLPEAEVEVGDAPEWVDAVVERVDGGRVRDVPLDIQGTAFQERVWAELRRIPPGETRSYGALAAELGTGPRAIARACASNPVAVLIPCHRVVQADGGISGYRWGPTRKSALLARERAR